MFASRAKQLHIIQFSVVCMEYILFLHVTDIKCQSQWETCPDSSLVLSPYDKLELEKGVPVSDGSLLTARWHSSSGCSDGQCGAEHACELIHAPFHFVAPSFPRTLKDRMWTKSSTTKLKTNSNEE